VSPAAQAASADSIRAVLDRVFAAPEYDWEVRRHPLQFLLDWYRAVLTWLDELAASHPIAYWVVIGLLVGILVATLAHFAYLVVRALRPRAVSDSMPSIVAARSRDSAWHVAEARRLALAGRFSEALAHRFVALVLELDQGGALRYHPSKTPAEYVNEARLGAAAADEFRVLVAVLYGHLFGGALCSEQALAAFDRRAAALAGQHAAT